MYKMTETSYKPNKGIASNSGEIITYRPAMHQGKSNEEMFLHVTTYMKEVIKVLAKKAKMTKPNKNDIDSLNRANANKTAVCLVAIFTIRPPNQNFQCLEKC